MKVSIKDNRTEDHEDQATVGPNGVFYAGPYAWRSNQFRWSRGRYRVEIVADPSDEQPDLVKAQAGDNWEKFNGLLVRARNVPGGRRPEFIFAFSYDDANDFSFWKSGPPGATIPPPDLAWTMRAMASRIASQLAFLSPPPSDASVDLTTPSAAEPSQSNPDLQTIARATFGCIDRDYFDKIGKYAAEGDKDAWMRALQEGTDSGQCAQFAPDEKVYLDDTAIFSGLVKVRRPGETQGYWMTMESVKR